MKTEVKAPTYDQVVKNRRNSIILSIVVDLIFVAATVYFIIDGTMTNDYLMLIIGLILVNVGFVLFNSLFVSPGLAQWVEISDEGIKAFSKRGLIKKYAWNEIEIIRKDEIKYVSNGFSFNVLVVSNGNETKPIHLYNSKDKPIVMNLCDEAMNSIDAYIKIKKLKIEIE